MSHDHGHGLNSWTIFFSGAQFHMISNPLPIDPSFWSHGSSSHAIESQVRDCGQIAACRMWKVVPQLLVPFFGIVFGREAWPSGCRLSFFKHMPQPLELGNLNWLSLSFIMNTGTGTWCFPLSRLRKTFARLHTICRDCRCDILSDIELDRLEQDLGRLKCTDWQILHQWFDFALECTFSVNLIQFEIQCGAGCWWFAIRSKFPGPWTVPKDPTCQPTCWWI